MIHSHCLWSLQKQTWRIFNIESEPSITDNGSHVNQVIASKAAPRSWKGHCHFSLWKKDEKGTLCFAFWSPQSSILRHTPGHLGLPWNQTLCDKPGRNRNNSDKSCYVIQIDTEYAERCTEGTLSPNLHQVLLLHRGHLLWSPQFWHANNISGRCGPWMSHHNSGHNGLGTFSWANQNLILSTAVNCRCFLL